MMTNPRPKKSDPDPVMLALRYPFDRGDVALDTDAAVLLVNPMRVPEFSLAEPGRVALWQWWKNAVDDLDGWGRLLPAAGPGAEDLYDAALIRLPRQREEGQFLIAVSWARLKPGGLLMVAAANDGGGARLEKDLAWLAQAGRQSASKYKCRVVWARKGAEVTCPPHWIADGVMRKHEVTGFWTQPGLFSWDRVDPATNLLMPYLPRGLSGVAADLGCGYGALALRLLADNPGLKKLHCADADARALQACEKTVTGRYPAASVDYHWLDLSRPSASGPAGFGPVDLVVMNPPFHAEKALAIDTGQAFISNAAAMLKKTGELLMVANAHLPYEGLLHHRFKTVEKKFEGQGFKIFSAKP